MSITAGYFTRKGQVSATEDLRERVSQYRIVPSEVGGNFLVEVIPIRFGHLTSKFKQAHRHRTPTVVDQDGNALMISGYLFPPGPDDADAYRRLLSLCVESHGKVLEDCEGEFVCLFAETHSGDLHIVNDRFGACPFYILQAGDRTFFSSNLAFLRFLAGGRLESDVLGWLQIFTWDHAVGARTHLRAVSRLLPASHLILSQGGARQHQYWRLRQQVDEHSDPTDTATRVFDAFRQATQRRAGRLRKGIIALSGGLDARLLAGALPEGTDFSAFTFADSLETPDTPDVRVAAEISKILGLRHTIKPIPEVALSPRRVADIIALTGGLVGVHHTVKTMECISAIGELGLDCQMGSGPASLAGGRIPSAEYLDPAKTEQCMRAYAQKFRFGTDQATLLGRLFHRDVLREYYPRLAPSLMESFETLEGPTAAHRVAAWTMAYRQFAFTFTCPTHSHPDVTEAQPHLGYDYTDLMLQLPAAWLFKRTFYQFMIFQCLPRLREVVYANTGVRLSGQLVDVNSGDSGGRGYYHSLLAFVGRPLRAMIPWRRRGKTFAYDLLRHNTTQLLSNVAEIIRSRRSLGEILDVGKCTQFVNGCRAGHVQGGSYEEDAHLLGALSTMCYVFESFDI